MNNKIINFIILLAIFMAFFFNTAEARQGCCSWHGGVCGCDSSNGRQICCDGSYSPSCTCGITPPQPPQPRKPSCSDTKAGTCNVKIYTTCEQKAYDNCVKEENFWIEHKKNVRSAVKQYLCRSATQADVDFYSNHSRDLNKIIDLMKSSEDYKKCQTESNKKPDSAEENIEETGNDRNETDYTDAFLVFGLAIPIVGYLIHRYKNPK